VAQLAVFPLQPRDPLFIPGRGAGPLPLIHFCLRNQLRNISLLMPSHSATRAIDPRGLFVSARTPKTIPTARSRSSAGCGFLDTMSPNLPRGHGLRGTRGGPSQTLAQLFIEA
jgi:hypothetical protein